MEEIPAAATSAQRALLTRHHTAGTSPCGYHTSTTLAKVAKDHNILDLKDIVNTIVTAHELDGKIQVPAATVREWLAANEEFSFIDVRTPDERGEDVVPEAEILDYNDSGKYMGLPKERKLVFLCVDGGRSLDVASYFIGHQFTQVFCLEGGVAGWRA